ncbi:hypothetical protein N474_03300 [Pseudoalteromonas luteoviolacea CPMOR-2]|uniref:hypothetical protein n=1 Tax=Pseudoalteromonas luteoviolacea TaxID=43657 RepID=UPI0007B0B291|nr:hypothetical protein [Pseudoalteromonas luteoviolacea]KZN51798.1 hypothetical protein N474_03300 [Pseudoalteromonas luteoviolacea CPMOR-2]
MKKILFTIPAIFLASSLSCYANADEDLALSVVHNDIQVSDLDITPSYLDVPTFKKYFRYLKNTDEVVNITSQCRVLTFIFHDRAYDNVIPVNYKIFPYQKVKLHRSYNGLTNRTPIEQKVCS